MAVREFDETFQNTDTTGAAEVAYTSPAGEVAVIQKISLTNIDTSTNAIVDLWFDPDGGSSFADGDKNHYIRDRTLAALETYTVPAAGRKIPPSGQIGWAVSDATGGGFVSSVNLHVSGVLVTQSRAATGTSA